MQLVVGLGNPGDKYKNTRHNIGFMVIDEILDNHTNYSTINNSNFIGQTFKLNNTIYLKPQTFMNLSGQSVKAVMDYYKIELEDIFIIHDDLDLEFGAIRFKRGGGSGGHNGLKSIDSYISADYNRIRLGIGKPEDRDIINYVLKDFSKFEFTHMPHILSHTIKALEALKTEPLKDVSSKYSIKKPEFHEEY